MDHLLIQKASELIGLIMTNYTVSTKLNSMSWAEIIITWKLFLHLSS